MIGNDVVDLADADSDPATRHPRFDARVFAPAERQLLQASADPEWLRWTLWAAKESAFKVARRLDSRTIFAPSGFVVRPECDGATVLAGEHRFRVRVTGDREHVHAVAYPIPVDVRYEYAAAVRCERGVGTAGRGRDDRSVSAAARRFAVAVLARMLHAAPADVVIRRQDRMPTLWVRGRRTHLTLSLSHHGRYLAFACAFPGEEGWS